VTEGNAGGAKQRPHGWGR